MSIITCVEGLIIEFDKTTTSPSIFAKDSFISASIVDHLEASPFFIGDFNRLESYNDRTDASTREFGAEFANPFPLIKIGRPSLVFTKILEKSFPS